MILCLDCETTTFQKGNPYSPNKLVSVHCHDGKSAWSYDAREYLGSLKEWINKADLLIFFNAKFDIAWLRKEDIDFKGKRIWDVQLAHFLLQRQSTSFPSLDDVLTYYSMPLKHSSIVKNEYWDKGIDTDRVPWNILCEYGEYDVEGTCNCYLRQLDDFKTRPQLYKLFRLQCQDLLVLHEMEWNGLKYNSQLCEEKFNELEQKISAITRELGSIYPDVPINFNSVDHLSAFLYGGKIKEIKKELIGYYKTGDKTGSPRFKNTEFYHELPRLIDPLKSSALSKDGLFSTNEGVLRKLRGTKRAGKIIEQLLILSKLEKLNGTYYRGMNEINEEMKWPKDILHGQYHQVVAKTGRLSSSKPNQQNMAGDILEIFESRYSGENEVE